jgi:hypothetical protein
MSRDPKLFGLYPFDDEDRKEKAEGEVFQFIKGRQAALEKYPTEAPQLADWYAYREAENGLLYNFYLNKLDVSGREYRG